jgi:hypothetical protein
MFVFFAQFELQDRGLRILDCRFQAHGKKVEWEQKQKSAAFDHRFFSVISLSFSSIRIPQSEIRNHLTICLALSLSLGFPVQSESRNSPSAIL